MTDFTTWDRATLEQFAREAMDKLVAMAQVEPVAWLCKWPDWHQYHDKDDPLPDTWDDDKPSITPLYTSATTIPEGYALVPVDPTKEMIIAGEMQIGRHAYKAMLSAAPKHSPTEEKEQ